MEASTYFPVSLHRPPHAQWHHQNKREIFCNRKLFIGRVAVGSCGPLLALPYVWFDVPVGQANTTSGPGPLGHVHAISTATNQQHRCLSQETNCSSLLLCAAYNSHSPSRAFLWMLPILMQIADRKIRRLKCLLSPFIYTLSLYFSESDFW